MIRVMGRRTSLHRYHLLLCLLGCGADAQSRENDGRCDGRPSVTRQVFGPFNTGWYRKLIFVMDDELRPRMRERVRRFATQLTTGDRDEDGLQEAFAEPRLAVTIATPPQAQRLIHYERWREAGENGCTPFDAPLPTARFEYEPYDQGSDDARFATAVDCLFDANDPACLELPVSEPFPSEVPSATLMVLLTEHNLCPGLPRECDQWAERTLLLQTSPENYSERWPVVVFAPAPAELIQHTFEGYWHREDPGYGDRVLADPRMHDGSNLTCGDRLLPSATDTFRLMVDIYGEPLAFGSICADDLAGLFGYLENSCGADALAWGSKIPIHDATSTADGRIDCTVEEILPKDGPISHCAQLESFGRVATREHDGHEICEIVQLPPSAAAPPGFGFYLRTTRLDGYTLRPEYGTRGGLTVSCRGQIDDSPPTPHFTPQTLLVPGSQLEVRCKIAPKPFDELDDVRWREGHLCEAL